MYAHAQHGAGARSRPFLLFLVFAFWILTLFEPEWFLTATVGGEFYRISTFLALLLGLCILSRGDERIVYWPLILFALMHLGASLLAENAGLSRGPFKFMVYMLLLFAGSVSSLNSPSRLMVVLRLYLLSFAWFGLHGMLGALDASYQGVAAGQRVGAGVAWHPLLRNEDSYGPLMVIAMAFSYFFALGTSSPRWRWLARGIFVLSVLGVVASFARGAALGAGAVLLHIALRSPRRVAALIGLALTVIALLPVAALVLPLDAYIDEIRSVSEGDASRFTLWRTAWNVFLESPVYGVGAVNFGVVAARITGFDATSTWSTPGQFYLLAVHNPHLQILAEEGIIGTALWIGMIAGFFRWNRRVRMGDTSTLWRTREGEDFDIKMIARGLEGAMVGYLATSVFYNQLYIHWFWSLLTIAYVLAGLTDPTREDTKRKASGHRVAGSWGGSSVYEKT